MSKSTFREAREAMQVVINREVMGLYEVVKDEARFNVYQEYRLRTCQASVILTTNFIVLRSYDTIVAFIDKYTNTMYDVLRTVYGYKAKFAKHISIFKHDYYYIDCITTR